MQFEKMSQLFSFALLLNFAYVRFTERWCTVEAHGLVVASQNGRVRVARRQACAHGGQNSDELNKTGLSECQGSHQRPMYTEKRRSWLPAGGASNSVFVSAFVSADTLSCIAM
jgi:hypothetical protein